MNNDAKRRDLVFLSNKKDLIGYVIIGGMWACVRWLEGKYKGQVWISVGREELSLITDEEIIKEFNTKYPFENYNSFKGTENLLNNDLFNK